jgi:hypothetical protein
MTGTSTHDSRPLSAVSPASKPQWTLFSCYYCLPILLFDPVISLTIPDVLYYSRQGSEQLALACSVSNHAFKYY